MSETLSRLVLFEELLEFKYSLRFSDSNVLFSVLPRSNCIVYVHYCARDSGRYEILCSGHTVTCEDF